jgi:hypothetical protein
MSILLVNAPLSEITEHARVTLPLGLAYIGAVLRGAGYDVSAIDLNVTPLDNVQIAQVIKRTLPVILAISTNTPNPPQWACFARLA